VKATLALLLVALTGCTAAPLVAPAPMPTQTPTPVATYDSDVVFVISATTTSADGHEVELMMTGHASQPFDARPEIKQSYVDQCAALGGGTVLDREGGLDDATLTRVGSSLMVIETVSTPAATTLTGGIELLLGRPFYTVVASGDALTHPAENACYGGYQISATGSVTSITNYETGSLGADLAQWRSGRYGFSVAFDSTAVLSDCEVTITQLAIDSGVGSIDGLFADGGTEFECAVGYRGL
jgi:hypothetical protein